MDLRSREVFVADVPAKLGGRAFDLLAVLAEQCPRLLSKAELMGRVWPHLVVEENNLSVHIAALRKVLGRDAIATVPGRGYQLALIRDEPIEPVAELAQRPHQSDVVDVAPATAAVATTAVAAAANESRHHGLHGREPDLVALAARIAPGCCTTLVGPAGVGKTALARVLAAQAKMSAVWIDLTPVRDGATLPALVGKACEVSTAGAAPLRMLGRGLAGSLRLVAIDNAEHLVGDVAALVRAVLDAAPEVAFLITSQVPLHVRGEWIHRLETLPVPAGTCTAAEAASFAAVSFFVEQVSVQDRRFALDDGNVELVLRICRRLDGLPLALKLAAARASLLGLRAVDERLEERLRLLSSNARDGPQRHASLRAALDWSHDLLDVTERQVLCRLSVLQGAFTLELASALASDDGADTVAGQAGVDGWTATEALANLVDRSWVEFVPAPQPHYRLLDSVREYAREQLVRTGELAAASRRAAALMRGRFPALEARDPAALARLLADADAPAEALAQWLEAAQAAGAAMHLVEVEHHLGEASSILRSAKTRIEGADRQRLALLLRLGSIAGLTHGLSSLECEATFREALALAEALHADEARFIALFNLGFTATMRLQRLEADDLGREMRVLAQRSGDERWILQAEHADYSGAFFYGDLGRTTVAAEAGYRRYRPVDSPYHCQHFAGHDPGICAAGHAAMAHLVAGRLDDVDLYLAHMHQVLDGLAHAPSRIIGASVENFVRALKGDVEAVRQSAQEVLTLCRRLEIPMWESVFSLHVGWAEALDCIHPDPQGLTRMAAAIERVLSLGTRFRVPTYRALLVEALAHHRQIEQGLAQAELCLQEMDAQGEQLMRACVLCSRAALNEQRLRDDLARADWQQAAVVADRQGARLFGLRAATGMAALEAREGQPGKAAARLRVALTPFAPAWRCAGLDRARAQLSAML